MRSSAYSLSGTACANRSTSCNRRFLRKKPAAVPEGQERVCFFEEGLSPDSLRHFLPGPCGARWAGGGVLWKRCRRLEICRCRPGGRPAVGKSAQPGVCWPRRWKGRAGPRVGAGDARGDRIVCFAYGDLTNRKNRMIKCLGCALGGIFLPRAFFVLRSGPCP